MINMNNHKRYKGENGDYFTFDTTKFKSTFNSNARAKGIKKEQYAKELAGELSISYDTLIGWKKGKNSPQDLETVHSLEKALGKPLNSLLYSKEAHLNNELNKAKQENANLVMENSYLKHRLEEIETDDEDSNMINRSATEKFSFSEVTDSFSLRYEGFSNLIDFLIGKYIEIDAEEDISSTYAEEISYILSEYIYDYSLPEIIGFVGKRSKEEIETYINDPGNGDNGTGFQWIFEAIVDSHGNRLFDKNGKVMLSGIDFFNRLRDGSVFNESDTLRIHALIDELEKKWDNFIFPYAILSISIMDDDKEFIRYTYGDGLMHPTHEDRMEIVKDLLFLTNGNINKLAFQNVKMFHVDQFELEIEIAYDLKDLL